MMDDFTPATIETAETGIFVRWSGSGPPVLLLHGFPQGLSNPGDRAIVGLFVWSRAA